MDLSQMPPAPCPLLKAFSLLGGFFGFQVLRTACDGGFEHVRFKAWVLILTNNTLGFLEYVFVKKLL